MFGTTTLKTLAAAALLALAAGTAQAATLSIAGVPEGSKHSADNPCIISGVNCPQQPVSFSYTEYNNTGGLNDIDEYSPLYTVAQIRGLVGDVFAVMLDVNQTNDRSPQTLDLFAMYIGGVLTDTFTKLANGNVPAIHNGTGDADYKITGFTSLANLAGNVTVQFRAKMSGLNDGPEQFFLVAAGSPSPIPLPAAGWLLFAGLGGLVLAARRRKAA